MKSLKLFLLFSLFATAASAQFVTNSRRVADVYFDNKEYYAAAAYYKKALQISSDSSGFVVPYGFEKKVKEESPKKEDYEYAVYQLATSLRLYKNYADAESWYAIAKGFTNPKYVLSSFWYGETLRANQRFADAIVSFQEFLGKYKGNDAYTEKAKLEIDACNFALFEIKHPRLYGLKRLSNDINQLGSNYTPYLAANNFYFTSSRPALGNGKNVVLQDSKSNAKIIKKETPFLNAIYEVSGSPVAEKVSVKKLNIPNNKFKELASPALHPDGKTMYITVWDAKGIRKISRLNLVNGSWSEPEELGIQVNADGYNSMQPFVTKDGQYLIFASDKPGGRGKYDLWYSPIRTDGSLGQAINMGPTVNTAEDDEAPYYNYSTKKLLYSSNGKVGIGGLDFYESEGNFTSWTEPRNLGYPFNSSKDDLYFTPSNDDDTEGYISSDRASLCCLEIFHLKTNYLTIQGTLLDCKTMKPLPGAVVTLTDSLTKLKYTTDNEGKYRFKIGSNRKIKLLAEKQNYFAKSVVYTYDTLSRADTLFSPELCLTPFKKDVPIILKDVYYAFDSDQLTDASKAVLDQLYTIMVDNETIEIELSAHTDNIGTAAYNLDLSNRRAKSCVDYLVSKGIPANRMTSKGYGFSRPIAPNKFPDGKDNPAGRQLNRRTEFKVTKQ